MIHCDIGGRPRPRVIWVYGNLTAVKNESSRLQSFPNGTLLIRGVVEEDYGGYICHAVEDLEVSHEIKLVQPTSSEEKKIGKLFLLHSIQGACRLAQLRANSANVQQCYHNTGPQSTFLCHYVHYRTLSNTLLEPITCCFTI